MKTTATFTFLSLAFCYSSAHADTFGSGGNTFDIEFVTIGNPGNVADTTGDPKGRCVNRVLLGTIILIACHLPLSSIGFTNEKRSGE